MTYQLEYKRSGSGFYEVGTAGETLGERKLVYLDTSGYWRLANTDDASKMPSLGITLEAIPSGNRGRILTQGYVGDADWGWTVGATLYASGDAGELTETEPSTLKEQHVATAKTSDLIYLYPWESEDVSEETPSSNGKLVSLNESGDDITITTGGTFYQHTEIDETVVNNMTYDAGNKALQMDYTGSYLVSLSMSVSVDAADHKVHIGIGKNGSVGTYNKMDYSTKFANRVHNIAFTTIASNLSEDDLLTVEVSSDTNGDVISVYHCQLTALLVCQ